MTGSEFVEFNGYLWPADDTECRKVAFRQLDSLDVVYAEISDWRACIQAGGNCGVWPNGLAQHFDTVYTFEPSPVNFACLAHNCTDPKIVKLQAALGMGTESPMLLHSVEHNCGAHQVKPGGRYPVIAIDSLRLPHCGLIYLDIEGYEAPALRGARETIRRCKPVIALENKGLSRAYGIERHEVEHFVLGMGYVVAARPGKDVVFTPI